MARSLPRPRDDGDRRAALSATAPARRAARVRAALLFAGAAGALLCGCGRTMTEDDCRDVGDALRAAWDAQAKKLTPADPQVGGKASAVLKSEGEKLSSEWASDCRRELAGRPVDPKELNCLTHAKTLDEIGSCSRR